MCGRFALWTPPGTITRYFKVSVELEYPPRFNIAPGQEILVIRQTNEGLRLPALLRWGLIPGWAKEEAISYKLINARSESIREKSAFKAAFKTRRCLIPASGFYEWKKDPHGKQPFLIRIKDAEIFALAGIWESWKNPSSDKRIESCAILTTSANQAVARLHDRMPVIVKPDSFDLWLDATVTDSLRLDNVMRPYDDVAIEYYQVSKAVNNIRNDNSTLIEPQK